MALAAALITAFEGGFHHAYLDPPGIPTICYGSTKGVKLYTTATDQQCAALLGKDVRDAEKAVNDLVKVRISDKTKAALVSFVFNVGRGNFAKSTLLKKLNSGDIKGACNELPRWVYSGGKKLNGLVKRRNEELQLCKSGLS